MVTVTERTTEDLEGWVEVLAGLPGYFTVDTTTISERVLLTVGPGLPPWADKHAGCFSPPPAPRIASRSW
jgi:hypothetical protein